MRLMTRLVSIRLASLPMLVTTATALGMQLDAYGDTVTFDDFESYPLLGPTNPPAAGAFASQWNSDETYNVVSNNTVWGVLDDTVFDPGTGKFLQMTGKPLMATNEHWLAFSIDDIGPITGAQLSFDYCVQIASDLSIFVSESGPTSGRVAVPFPFSHFTNQGQLEGTTGVIDLSPYLSQTSSHLVVIFVGDGAYSTYSEVRIDNFALTTSTVPLPSALWSGLGLLGGLGIVARLRKRKPTMIA